MAMGLTLAGCSSEKEETPAQPAATEAPAPETTSTTTDAAAGAAQ